MNAHSAVELTLTHRRSVTDNIAIELRNLFHGDENAEVRNALLWLLRHSDRLTRCVAVTLVSDEHGLTERAVYDFAASLRSRHESVLRLNARIKKWGEPHFHFSHTGSYGYREGLCGSTIYREELAGETLATLWLGRLPNGCDSVTKVPDPNLVLLEFSGWQALLEELRSAGMA